MTRPAHSLLQSGSAFTHTGIVCNPVGIIVETLALIILAVLALIYIGVLIVGAIAWLPFGIIPLLLLFALGIFLVKSLRDKLGNTEDQHYNDRCEP